MTITVDVITENTRTGITSPQTFSHAGAGSGIKGVVLSIVHGVNATDHLTEAPTYGGVAMTRIVRATDTVDELGAAELWFLGAGVPQGTQTLSYAPGSTTDDIHATVTTLLADSGLGVIDFDSINGDLDDPSVTLQNATSATSAMAFAALFGGGLGTSDGGVTYVFAENANCSRVGAADLGNFYSYVLRQTTAQAGTAEFVIGGTTTALDDMAFVAMSVAETTGSSVGNKISGPFGGPFRKLI